MTFLKEISSTIIRWHREAPVMMTLLYILIFFAVLVNVYPHLKVWICKKKLKKLEEPLFMHYFRNYGENIFQETILDEIRQKYDFKMLKLVGIVCCLPNPDREKLIRTGLSIEEICDRVEYFLLVDKGCIVGRRHPIKSSPDTQSEAPTPQQSQSNPSNPAPAQQAPTEPPKAPNKPNLSIEEELLKYLKAQPICWEFPLTTQDKALNQFCETLVFSDNVTAVTSNDALRNLEMTIQKKRARNPRLADHNAAMERNILAMLYEYSYLMHIFHALDDMKFDTTKVDMQKLWLLIQKDCNARIDNLEEEKRKNPIIQVVLSKYNYDNQIVKLKVLNDATGREMDYIISFMMDYYLLTTISLLFSNPKLLQALKPYSADDIAGMMNALINTSAGLRFTAYSR